MRATSMMFLCNASKGEYFSENLERERKSIEELTHEVWS